MHIVIGLLGSIVTILYLLNRLGDLGIDFSRLNPFHWRRRRAWANKYEGDPIYSVEDPVQIAALLIVGVAKLDGDLSAEQKKVVIGKFESGFLLSSREATDLFGSATHLLGAPQVVATQIKGLADKNAERFSQEQAESMVEMMIDVASTDSELSVEQNQHVDEIRSWLVPKQKSQRTWS